MPSVRLRCCRRHLPTDILSRPKIPVVPRRRSIARPTVAVDGRAGPTSTAVAIRTRHLRDRVSSPDAGIRSLFRHGTTSMRCSCRRKTDGDVTVSRGNISKQSGIDARGMGHAVVYVLDPDVCTYSVHTVHLPPDSYSYHIIEQQPIQWASAITWGLQAQKGLRCVPPTPGGM